MGRRGILNLVNCFHRSVYCSVKADGIFGTGNIKVDSSGKSYCVDTQSGQSLGSAVRTVSTDDNNTVNSMLATDVSTLFLIFRFLELEASCCSQNSTASLDNIGNITSLNLNNLFVQESGITSLDSLDLQSSRNRCTCHRTNRCVHSGSISSAGKYRNCLNLV